MRAAAGHFPQAATYVSVGSSIGSALSFLDVAWSFRLPSLDGGISRIQLACTHRRDSTFEHHHITASAEDHVDVRGNKSRFRQSLSSSVSLAPGCFFVCGVFWEARSLQLHLPCHCLPGAPCATERRVLAGACCATGGLRAVRLRARSRRQQRCTVMTRHQGGPHALT